MGSENRAQSQSMAEPRSESKKRGIAEVEEISESSHKRVKMRDLASVLRSEREGCSSTHLDVNTDSRTLDLNINAANINLEGGDEASSPFEDFTFQKEELGCNDTNTKSRRFDLGLNASDISNSINDPFYPYKNYEHMKSKDDSECGSCVGPLDEKESMRVWKGLKQNNYMSSSHGYAPVPAPKPRGRKKNKNDFMKKIEFAKKEQVDRFARVAAPSGLLNGLNPGIINHVRNSKQVHSIIEALVRSARSENRHSGSKQDNHTQELIERKELHGEPSSDVSRYGLNHGDIFVGRRQMTESIFMKNDVTGLGDASRDGETRTFFRMSEKRLIENENDDLTLKLSSCAVVASENASCLSNEESANLTSVNSLSIQAANVASQWLELLNQDIKGRIAALRRSRKRVRAVISTELPHLISREFSPELEKAAIEAHSARWSNLFAQMDKTLSEEESQLECMLNQIKEMQLHCEKGLYKNNPYHSSQQAGSLGNNSRSETENVEKDLAVRAAAASIYSTCNFLFPMENPPCC